MADRAHIGTLLWGVFLTLWGVVLLGVGLDWWQFELVDLRYLGPALIIVIGVIVLLGALRSKDTPGR